MAKARKTFVIAAPVTAVELTLTMAEAEVLATVLNHVGGPPEGKRGNATAILQALKDAGVYYDALGKNDGVRVGTSIYF
jgi:hypothetical protein